MKVITIHEGVILKIGRDAEENARLVRMSDPESIWFHLSKFPSPHGVLVFPSDTEISEDLLRTCASHVKALSKHKNAPNISIDMLPIKYVKNIDTHPGTVSLLKHPKRITV